MLSLITKFIDDELGGNAIEYAISAGLMSTVIIGALTSVGSRLNTMLSNTLSGLN